MFYTSPQQVNMLLLFEDFVVDAMLEKDLARPHRECSAVQRWMMV
jgi:hypothetical protein